MLDANLSKQTNKLMRLTWLLLVANANATKMTKLELTRQMKLTR